MSTNLSNAARFFSDSDLKKIKSMNKKARDLLRDNVRSHWWNISRYSIICDLIKSLRLPMNSRVLELGVGTGDLISALAFSFKIGIDSFRYNQPYHGFKFIQGDINFLPLKKESMDLLLLLDVLEHTNQHEKVLKNIYAILKKDGILIMTVPAYEWLYSYWDRMLGHIRRYTIVGAKTVVRSAGFTVAKSSYFNSFILPLVIVFRLIKSMTRTKEKASDFISLPDSINAMFIYLSNIETILLHHMGIPFGLSVLIVAKK